ncbi:MAG: hypothetical protein M1815_004173 [Lichina confinis]|nr:MAG: hypothetical protein M1815_004173 [Lichina confinis]
MDASAHLAKQGWRGSGHALDPAGRGIVKPLLVSRKRDTLGVGNTRHDLADQWWSRAFDASIRSLDVTGKGPPERSKPGRPEPGPRPGHAARHLYSFFQRGETLKGTIGDESAPRPEAQHEGSRGPEPDPKDEEDRTRRRERRKRRRKSDAPETETDGIAETRRKESDRSQGKRRKRRTVEVASKKARANPDPSP